MLKVAQIQSVMIGDSFLKELVPSIIENTNYKIQDNTLVFAFLNRIIFFSPNSDEIAIFDDTMTMISIVVMTLKAPILSIAFKIDSGVIEYIDSFNNRYPLPLMGNS
jgi:hypothetical protein